ncbi:MAG: hypothetical protein ACI8VY_000568, partial [Cellvibrionaceae bacterium]
LRCQTIAYVAVYNADSIDLLILAYLYFD